MDKGVLQIEKWFIGISSLKAYIIDAGRD